MGQPRPLYRLFSVFQTNNTIFTTNQCEKCLSSVWQWDSNPRPFEHESSPIITRPGLPPTVCLQKWDMKWTKIDENEAGLVICKRHSTHTSILRLRNDSLRETIGGIYRWARSSNGTLWKWFRLKLRGRYFMKDVWKSYFIEIYFHRRHRARITTSWMPFQQT